MGGEGVEEVFDAQAGSSFDSLMSEWDHAGFIWEVVAGLSSRGFARLRESRATLRVLITAGKLRALAHLILVFPDIRARLRVLRLFIESALPDAWQQVL